MRSDDLTMTLGQLAEIEMGQSPPGSTVNNSGSGVPLLNGPTEFGPDHPVPTQFTTDARKFAEPGDLLFCVRGSTTGRMNWADQQYAIGRGIAALRMRSGRHLQPLLRGLVELHLPSLLAAATGSTFPNVSRRQLEELEVVVPSEREQCRIAAVLGALDDRIEVNRRMNRTLEAMAQALFRSRFVDFDGRDDPDTSGRAPLPSGWRWGKPADLIKFDPRMKLKKGTVARYLGMSEVPTEGFAIGELEERPYKGGSKFVLGDTLLARITPSLENGKTALVDFLEPGEVGFGSTEFIVMRGREGTPREFVYCLARSPEFRQFAIKHMTGSSGRQRVARDVFDHYDLPIPPRVELADFAQATRPMFDRISANHRHARTLADLRDALLPKLVSGEIRVPHAIDAVPAAATAPS